MKKECTAITIGIISEIKSKGVDFPTIITVVYEVNGRSYELKESLKYKVKLKKLGFLPIGQENIPVMGNSSVGSEARVLYEPGNPSNAYLADNAGIINI